MVASEDAERCPVDGCDDPATTVIEDDEKTITLCETHAEMAENEGAREL